MSKKREDFVLERYRRARNKRQKKDSMWKELDAFDRNEQWDLESAPPWLPKPVTNFIHLVKNTKRAALAMENPTGKLRPVSPAGIQRVEQLNKGFQYAWERIKARKVVRQNIETAKLLGTGIAYVYWDENKEGRMGTTVQGDEGYQFEGEIGVRELDVATFYPDPTAFSIDECQYICVRERKSKEWYKSVFKKIFEDMGVNAPEERGEIYLRDYDTEQNKDIIDLLSYYEKTANAEGGYDYTVEYVVNGKYVEGSKKKLRPNRYPFAILYDFPQRQDIWGLSTCYFILDNQKIINKVESIIAMIGTLMQNPQKIVSEQSGIDPVQVTTYGSLPGFTIKANGDPTRAIHYVVPPQIPMALFNLLENAKNNIREITGLTEAYLGQTVGSLQTSSGVQSLIERATMRDRDQMYDIELYIEDLSKLILDFMVEYYEEPRMIRVMGESPDQYDFEWFTGKDYRDLDYDIFLDVSSKAPVTRMREANEAKELLNMQGQYGGQFGTSIITPQEAIKMMDIMNKDEIIKRMDMEEMRNRTEEAMQIAQMMTEALASGVDPQEAYNMGIQMFEQMEAQMKGMGSTSNSNNVQMQQQGT